MTQRDFRAKAYSRRCNRRRRQARQAAIHRMLLMGLLGVGLVGFLMLEAAV